MWINRMNKWIYSIDESIESMNETTYSMNRWINQGGNTPIYSVLRSSSSVKMKVKGQPPKIADSQKLNCLLAGQESTSSFM